MEHKSSLGYMRAGLNPIQSLSPEFFRFYLGYLDFCRVGGYSNLGLHIQGCLVPE